jgi:hypothetical protein
MTRVSGIQFLAWRVLFFCLSKCDEIAKDKRLASQLTGTTIASMATTSIAIGGNSSAVAALFLIGWGTSLDRPLKPVVASGSAPTVTMAPGCVLI